MAREDKHAKTERPTPKRRKEARDRGQVARSPDVSAWAATLVGSFVLPWYFGQAERRVLGIVQQARNVMGAPTPGGAFAVLTAGLRVVIVVVLPLGAVAMVLAIITNIAQVGRAFSLKAATPRFSRINPKSGFKRLFGPQTLEQLGKQTLKLTVLGSFGYLSIVRLMHSVTGSHPVTLLPILGAAASAILSFIRMIALFSLSIGIGDFAFQKRRLMTSLKMTKQEVKEESKSSEGDPTMKGHLRKRQYMIARSRAIAAVRTADVVVTNPTHFAVALQYQPGGGGAPRVVSKGSDNLAKIIREKAAEALVPIVEDAPLARYLFAVCEIDQQIPHEIYVAVARLLAFVYALPATTRGAMVHRAMPTSLPESPIALDGLSEGRRRQAEAIIAGATA